MRYTVKSRIGWILAALLLVAAEAGAAADLRVLEAAKQGDIETVRGLLAEGLDVNVRQPDGATALHWAANRDDLGMTQMLLDAGAVVDAANDYGVTALSLAALNGGGLIIDTLLEAGADPHLPLPTGETPLMTASYVGSVGAVARLLEAGANIDASEDAQGQTALMWALSEEHLPVVRLLIDGGANIHARTVSGFTPLMFAVRQGNREATDILLNHGAQLNDAAEDGVTVLMVAVMRGHASLAEYLLMRGADPNVDTAGYTALHWAAGVWESSMSHDYPTTTDREWRYLGGVPDGKLELIRALIEHGADVNVPLTENPPRYGINLFNSLRLKGTTPFFLAALSADVEVMRLLLSSGADPHATNEQMTTPLMAAAGLGRVPGDSLITDDASRAAVELCLKLGNDINAANTNGDTALHGTAYYGNEQTAAYLAEMGADLNPQNKKGQTPLGVAEGYTQNAMLLTRPRVAEVLREHGATVN